MTTRGNLDARTSDDLLDVVGRVYESALRPLDFSEAVSSIARLLDARTGAFVVQDVQRRRVISSSLVRVTAEEMSLYERDWLPMDHGSQRVLPGLPQGTIATEEDVPNFYRSEIYEGYFRRREMDHMMACLAANTPSVMAFASFHRPRRRGAFTADEQTRFRRLVPHLARATTLQRHLLDGETRARLTAEALDALGTAVVIFDTQGAPVLVNRAATILLKESDGLSCDRRGLRADLANEHALLQGLIRAALRTGSGLGSGAGGEVRISRPSLRKDYVVIISPLKTDTSFLWTERAAAVAFIRDPERASEIAHRSLQRLWGLTPVEAHVCAELVQGRTIEEIAVRLHVATDTVRKHVKQLFGKTGTNRQASLTALVLSCLAGIQPSSN